MKKKRFTYAKGDIMKPFISCLLICVMVLFTGCGQEDSVSDSNVTTPPTSSSSESDVSETEPVGLKLVTSPYGAFNETFGKDGFYSLQTNPNGGSSILYADYATRSAIMLCNRLECQHQDETCPAWFPFSGGRIFLNSAQDTLFCIGEADAGEQRTETIWRMDLNGSNRRILYQCPPRERIMDAIASDASSLYFSVYTVDYATAAYEKNLMQVDLQTGESKPIHALNDSDWLFGACGDKLLLLYGKDTQYRYTLFSPSDGTETEVFSFERAMEKPETSLQVAPHDGYFYVFSPNEGSVFTPDGDATAQLSKIDMVSGESEVLCDDFPWFGAEHSFIQSFYDNHMIIDLHDTRENDPAKVRHYRYYIDCETGSYKESTLTYTQYALTPFVTIVAETPDCFIVSKGLYSTSIPFTDTDGSTYERIYDVPDYAFIAKEDFWNNIPNYQEIDYKSLLF